jgi:lipopolysaccharide/colanic/teichoic acid biosynthesis glycosyltransferase
MRGGGACDGSARAVASLSGAPLVRSRFWQRGGVQLGGGIVLAAAIPFSVAAMLQPLLPSLDLFSVSLAGSLAGVGFGYWMFRNLIAFPGIRASYYVLPVFSSTFAAIFAVFFLFRLDYSRPLLVASFVIAVTWYYTVYFMIQRRHRFEIAVVPFGRVDSLYAIESVQWMRLSRPDIPRDCATLAADFDHALAPEWVSFLAECALAGISVLHYKQLRQSLTGQVQMERLSENAFGSLVPNASYVFAKAVIDFLIALALLPIVLPLLLAIALAVTLDSPGPIFFRQTRIGYRGRPFRVWKFRTMRCCVTAADPPVAAELQRRSAITTVHDARITRVGRALRRSRMDEIPQILNVLRGEMSWIGPRPEAVVLSQWYETEIPFYRYRHVVRPGISGWAQVNQGHVAEIDDVLTKLSYDFFYISRFTFWIDMLIVVRTIKTLLTGFGSR